MNTINAQKITPVVDTHAERREAYAKLLKAYGTLGEDVTTHATPLAVISEMNLATSDAQVITIWTRYLAREVASHTLTRI
jgi:hypothetical protein